MLTFNFNAELVHMTIVPTVSTTYEETASLFSFICDWGDYVQDDSVQLTLHWYAAETLISESEVGNETSATIDHTLITDNDILLRYGMAVCN